MTNTVKLSDDRRDITIHSADGRWTARLRSIRPGGFTDEQAFKALDFEFTVYEPNEHVVAWRKKIVGNWYFYAVINTGPPTWWWPRIKVNRVLGIGWLRALVEVSISKGKVR